MTLFATTFAHYLNTIKHNNAEWESITRDQLEILCELLPSGSGFDCGTTFDFLKSLPTKLLFTFEYHHLNDNGYYDRWTKHIVKVVPTFGSFELSISGPDYNQSKEYFYQVFNDLFSCSEFAAMIELRKQDHENKVGIYQVK